MRYILFIVIVLTAETAVAQPTLTRTLKEWQPMKNHPARVAFSPDGSKLAVANVLSKDIRIFTVPGFKLFRTVGKPGEAHRVVFAPDNKILAAGSRFSHLVENRNSIRLWNVETGEVVWEPAGFVPGEGAENDVEDMTLSPDGRKLVASLHAHLGQRRGCCFLFLVDLDTKATTPFSSAFSNSVAFSPDGEKITSAGFGHIETWSSAGEGPIWSTPVKREIRSVQNLQGTARARINMVSHSPDGARMLVSSEGTVTVHRASDGQQEHILPVRSDSYEILAAYLLQGAYIVAAAHRLWIIDAKSLNVVEESALPKSAVGAQRKSAFSLSVSARGDRFAVGTNYGDVLVKEFVPR